MNKGDHQGPESVLENESDLVSELVRAFRHNETEKGLNILREISRACFNEGAAMQRRKQEASSG